MRCLTLADALKERGAHTRFVSRHLPEHLRSKLVDNGHGFVLLENAHDNVAVDELAHAHWLGVSQTQDAADSIQALSDRHWDWIVVDHYALDSRWESRLRKSADKILAIDDIADRKHDCDVLLDQNLYADMETRYGGKVPAQCQQLLGPRFALLRDEFRKLHKQVKSRSGAVKRVMVFFGGMDADNYTGHAIEALAQLEIPGVHVDVVIGAQHPSRQQIEKECAQCGFDCHVQSDRMAELMAAADLAIGAGGAATWERCCLGLPTLALCTADNQQKQLIDAAQQGLLYSPEIAGDPMQVIGRHVLALIENGHLRHHISDKGMQTVDGCGVSRTLTNMGCFNGMVVRLATANDSERLFQWRNHPSIREISRNTDVIEWQDHQEWFASLLVDSKRWLLIGEDAGVPIGVVRFDAEKEGVEVSIYLAPEKASSGLGQDLLHSAEHWLVKNHPEVRRIHAHVIGTNERSLRFFSKAGFQMESADFSKRLH
ncbi:UDP-2,4-diacetamido-2,4,6-trideoxy-beta-L-altropyranose hydrolase [mine drainage metagenome]|uniref:UDP-2,4-diacetamido-2,4, 6-trideoxy-beta-L-altropyranose hydrolase n=1 Tax=mine drainage metagenome TaxID=410659 RepID=A0A1J5TDW0_9ZZZZ